MRIFDGFFSFMRELWALVKYAPWLPFAAIAGEAVQHAVEISFGMYVRGDGISPGYETNMRMLAAAIKVIGFIVTIALTMRCTRTEAIVFDQRAMTLDRSVVLAVIIVPVAIHYALNFLAVGRPPITVIAIIAIDTLVIGWLAMSVARALPSRRRDGTAAEKTAK